MNEGEANHFSAPVKTPRFLVWIGVSANAAWFFLAILILPNLLSSGVRSDISWIHAELRALAIFIDTYHTDHGAYPPGGSYDGAFADMAASLANPPDVRTPPDFARSYTLVRGHNSPRNVLIILGTLLVWYLCRPGRDRLPAHVLQGASSAILLLAVAVSNDPLHLVLSHIPGAVAGLAFILHWKFTAVDRQSGQWGAELRLAAFMPLALAIYCVGAVHLEGHVTRTREAAPENVYRYITDGETGWVLQHAGSDLQYDLDYARWPEAAHGEPESERLARFIERLRSYQDFYDPTNGLHSGGDLFRYGSRPEGE